jgi:hypothetical protein
MLRAASLRLEPKMWGRMFLSGRSDKQYWLHVSEGKRSVSRLRPIARKTR